MRERRQSGSSLLPISNFQFPVSGFTLVELLVVIAIISLLAAILMPTLNHAREGFRKVACASNLARIGVGLSVYASDRNGRLPLGGSCTGGCVWTLYRWGWRSPWYGLGCLYKHGIIDEGAVFFCPASEVDTRRYDHCATSNDVPPQYWGWRETEARLNPDNLDGHAGIHAIYGSYNYFLRWDPGVVPGHDPHWRDHFSEARSNLHTGSPGMAIATDYYHYWQPEENRTELPNHDDGTNVLYLDGHVQWWGTQEYIFFMWEDTPYDL